MSPSRPNTGVLTAAASRGAVVTQTTVEGSASRSSAIGWTAMVRIVDGNVVTNSPMSRATVIQPCERRTRGSVLCIRPSSA